MEYLTSVVIDTAIYVLNIYYELINTHVLNIRPLAPIIKSGSNSLSLSRPAPSKVTGSYISYKIT